MSFPHYPAYKDSGVEWLGEVPEHWSIERFKLSVISCANGVWGEEPGNGENDVTCMRVADFDRLKLVAAEPDEPTIRSVSTRDIEQRSLCNGDLLIEKSGGGEKQPVGAVVLYTGSTPSVCSNFVARMRLAQGMNPSFWRYAHHAAYSLKVNTKSIKQTSGIQNLDQQQYLDERAPFPPGEEQSAIAIFLDRETAKIDALIAEQHRLIELLQEKRQAVITHAVTKGLNPEAPMKDSGVEWLGEVPEHWEVCSMRRVLLKIEQGWSPECLASPAEEGEWGAVKAGCVNGGVFNQLDNKTLPQHLEPPSEYEIQAGDRLMSRASGSPDLIGSAAFVEHVRPRLLLSDKIFRLRTTQRVDSRYLADVLGSTPLRQQILRSISGAVGLANNLPQSEIKGFIVPLPPVNEQQEIREFICAEKKHLNALLSESESLIALLQERRSALISAAVTGQIDVRGLVPEASAA